MGCCCSEPVPDDVTLLIDERSRDYYREQRRVRKLLIVGTPKSGKSTLLRSLMEANGQSIIDERTEDLEETCNTMRLNVVTAMLRLCEKSVRLTEEGFFECDVDAAQKSVIEAVALITKISNDVSMTNGFEDVSTETLPLLGKAVAFLWSLPSIRATHALRDDRFFMEENMDFFLDKCEEIFEEDYAVTREDVIKNGLKTTGVVPYFFEEKEDSFQIVNSGELGAGSRFLLHRFDPSVVLFVAALSHFNEVAYNSEFDFFLDNAMHDTLDLFERIVNKCRRFEYIGIILILNKDDLFRQMLARGETLSLCFSPECQWEGVCWNDGDNPLPEEKDAAEAFEAYYELSLRFIQERFLDRIRKFDDNTIFTHVINAKTKQWSNSLLYDVYQVTARANLRKGGLLMDTISYYGSGVETQRVESKLRTNTAAGFF